MMHQKGANLLHCYGSSRFSCDAPKRLILDALLQGKTLLFYALLRGIAGLLMTRQKGANLLHYYVSK